ncbi:hypothetical protein [Bradyrhizobium zhanjiangense]|uniref:hypothetical protein n=1 Tax=Bradyrhizobium zhanjiangense TaxID=1325107 RepID=UPI003D318C4B
MLAEGGRRHRDSEKRGWMQDRADPYERERAFDLTRFDIPQGLSPEEALAELRDVLASIGDTCPDCSEY